MDIKMEWMKMPSEFFETLTFGEIPVGQKFIALPCPGDNQGHGGFKGTHYIFTKTRQFIAELNHGQAVDNRDISSDIPDSMPVIPVK